MNRLYNQFRQRSRAKTIPRTAVIALFLGSTAIGGYANANQLQAGIHALVAESALNEVVQSTAQGASTPALILLEADALVLTNDGSSTQITARVRDDVGQPVAGVTVDFFQTTGGITVPESTVTNEDGEVTVSFMAGNQIGQAIVTAHINTLTQSEVIQIVKPQSDPQSDTIALEVGIAELGPGQQTSISATLRDGDGQPRGKELISIFGSLGEVSPASAVTDANGQVTVQYTAGNVGGAGRITALSGIASASLPMQINAPNAEQPPATATPNAPSTPDAPATPTAEPTAPPSSEDPGGSDNPGSMKDTFLPIIQ